MKDTDEKVRTEQKERGVLVSPLEGKLEAAPLPLQSQSSPLSRVGSASQIKLAKLSMNMKNHWSIHLKMLHSSNGSDLHGYFIQNPEWQIKILEKNLNFLNKKVSRSNNIQMKSNILNLQCTSAQPFLETKQYTFPLSSVLKGDGKSGFKLGVGGKHVFGDVCANETQIPNKCSTEDSRTFPHNGLLEKPALSVASKPKENIKSSCSNTLSSILIPRTYSNARKSWASISVPGNRSTETAKENDIDSQFEFTVEEEKIVSFVCSPSPPRKQRVGSNTGSNCEEWIEESDQEFDKRTEVSATVSNTSSGSSLVKDNIMTWEQFSGSDKDVHVPLLPQQYQESCSNNKAVYTCSSSQIVMKTIPNEKCDSQINFIGAFVDQKRLKGSVEHEAVLFRETSLRGCYDIENILKEMRSPGNDIVQEVCKVREEIFSAIRLKRSDDDLVLDSALSFLYICKSWIKLNSHFERNKFKDILETNGIGCSILNDFLKWQSESRGFMEKIIGVLKSISLSKKPAFNSNNFCNSNNINTANSQGCGSSNMFHLHSCNGNSNESLYNKTENGCTLPKSDSVQSKHWKQRRFLSDQPKSSKTTNAKTKKLCKSVLTMNGSCNGPQVPACYNIDMGCGQGDCWQKLCPCASHFGLVNPPSLTKDSHGDANYVTALSNYTQQSSLSAGSFENSSTVWNSPIKTVKDYGTETSMYPLLPINDVACNSSSNLIGFPVNQVCSVSPQTFPTIPPLMNTNFYLMSPNQVQASNISPHVIQTNPIHCVDTELTENCIRSSYMKPGCYNPPQKPVTFQKVIDNNLPIEDVPIVGIRFQYSGSQTPLQQPKGQNASNSSPQKQSSEISCAKRPDETWRAALSLAETFRDTLMSNGVEESPNLKLSETVSAKSHFLLSDTLSQDSSSSETDESSVTDNPTASGAESDLKTSDWLVKSFNIPSAEKETLDNDADTEDIRYDQKFIQLGLSQTSEESCQQNRVEQRNQIPLRVQNGSLHMKKNDRYTNSETQQSKVPLRSNPFQSIGSKRPRKNKRTLDNYGYSFDEKPIYCRKPKSVFKKPVNKQVACKLEDILNCIWNTELTDFFEEDGKSEKEASRLEARARSPLYLQALRCKLSNHSYDTVEQALGDFQQFFLDTKSRNKGDKQCMRVVGALEEVFQTLVEKHFGLIYQPTPQHFGPIGTAPSLKPRKPKKNVRRC